MVCLSCTATGERVCLAAEGFGNRHCFLENIADKNVPPDLSQCTFVIEQALSVRALQELVTAAGSESVSCVGLFFFLFRFGCEALISSQFARCTEMNVTTNYTEPRTEQTFKCTARGGFGCCCCCGCYTVLHTRNAKEF